MYRIREEHIAQKTTENGLELPRSVDMACPFCGRQVNFQLTSWTAAERAFARFTNAHCPGCRRLSSFLWVGMPPEVEEHLDEATVEYRLYIHPTPRSVREPLAGIDSLRDFGEALARAYRSAVAAYDAGQWV
ncbi:MAG: hypothetical protein ACRELC_12735, partial [Gemmatimonadota bacterium]